MKYESEEVVYDIVGVADDDTALFKIDGLRQRRFERAEAKT